MALAATNLDPTSLSTTYSLHLPSTFESTSHSTLWARPMVHPSLGLGRIFLGNSSQRKETQYATLSALDSTLQSNPTNKHNKCKVEVEEAEEQEAAAAAEEAISSIRPRAPPSSSSIHRPTPHGEVMGAPFPAIECLEAVLFDVDGTLCDSDPLHYLSFREMLQEVGFQGGVPINEEFFINHISGRENFDIGVSLFPDWDQDRRDKFLHEKEARFRSLAAKQLKPVEGLETLCQWIEESGLKRAAVTNAPRENAALMISLLGLTNFFEIVVVGGECERAKPFPDPYLKALKYFGLSSDQAFVLEDSSAGLKAAVAAGIAAVGVTTRNPGDSLLQAGATLVISDFKDPQLWNLLQGQP